MERVYQVLHRLLQDEAFLLFQNALINRVYDCLGKAYSTGENEVSMVTRLVEATNSETYGPISICSEKIHGSRSYVEFNFRDKPVTKELGDMMVISLVSDARQRLFQRLCIIQNKKEKDGKWDIDNEQLFLLKNFPAFSGNKGLFRNCRDVVFRNTGGCLGAYGLFHRPGDMVFVTAPILMELLRGRAAIAESDICFSETAGELGFGKSSGILAGLPHFPDLLEEFLHFAGPRFWRHGLPFLLNNGVTSSSVFFRDMFDFLRAWTHLVIGEVTFAFGDTVNRRVDAFANAALRRVGFADRIDIPADNQFAEMPFENEIGVFVMHVDVSQYE